MTNQVCPNCGMVYSENIIECPNCCTISCTHIEEEYPEEKEIFIKGISLSKLLKKKSIVFLVSDFLTEGFEDAIKIANKKHDVVALRIADAAEKILPKIGLIKLKNNETGAIKWVNTNDEKFRKNYTEKAMLFGNKLNEIFNRSGVDHTEIDAVRGYVKPLMNLFRRRESR